MHVATLKPNNYHAGKSPVYCCVYYMAYCDNIGICLLIQRLARVTCIIHPGLISLVSTPKCL